jgi:hypothetical protein
MDDMMLSDKADLRAYLRVVLSEIKRLGEPLAEDDNALIEGICNELDNCDTTTAKNLISEFHKQNLRWPSWFATKNEKLFMIIIDCHKLFRRAFVQCNEFDILESIEEQPEFEHFYSHVKKRNDANERDRLITQSLESTVTNESVLLAIYRLAHAIYKKSRIGNKSLTSFPVLSEISSDCKLKLDALNLMTGVGLGGIGIFFTSLGISLSGLLVLLNLVGGFVLSSLIIKPYLRDSFKSDDFKKLLNELILLESIEPDEDMYERSLFKLNANAETSNEILEMMRSTYLASFNFNNLNEKEFKRYIELEKAFKAIKKYRKKMNN